MCLQQILLCQPTSDWKAHEFNIHVSDCLRSMLRQHNVNNWSHLVFNHPVSGLDCTQKNSRVQVCDKSEFINNWTGVRVAQPLSWFVNGIKCNVDCIAERFWCHDIYRMTVSHGLFTQRCLQWTVSSLISPRGTSSLSWLTSPFMSLQSSSISSALSSSDTSPSSAFSSIFGGSFLPYDRQMNGTY